MHLHPHLAQVAGIVDQDGGDVIGASLSAQETTGHCGLVHKGRLCAVAHNLPFDSRRLSHRPATPEPVEPEARGPPPAQVEQA